jgi:hypothetical protein
VVVITEAREEEQVEGTISSVEDHGSIVIVWLDMGAGRSQPVYMDHRSFGWMLDGEGIETPDDLIGRPILYNGEAIEFLDSLEAA